MVNGGVTPLVDRATAQAMGYGIVIWPCLAMTAAYLAYRAAARELRDRGMLAEQRYADGSKTAVIEKTGSGSEPKEEGQVAGGIREIFELCGLNECAAFDRECGGKAYANGV